jgi:hypothetical protein
MGAGGSATGEELNGLRGGRETESWVLAARGEEKKEMKLF